MTAHLAMQSALESRAWAVFFRHNARIAEAIGRYRSARGYRRQYRMHLTQYYAAQAALLGGE